MHEAHRLLPPGIAAKLPLLYSTEDAPLQEKLVHVKLFTPWNCWTWWIIEYDPQQGIAFGLVQGFEREFGNFSISELESIRGPGGLRIERDLHFTPTVVRDLMGNDERTR